MNDVDVGSDVVEEIVQKLLVCEQYTREAHYEAQGGIRSNDRPIGSLSRARELGD